MAARQNQKLIENLKAIIIRQTELIDENKETINTLVQEISSIKKELIKYKNISTSKTRMLRKRASVKKDLDYDSGNESDSEDSDDSELSEESDDDCDYCSVTGKMFRC